MCIICYKPRGTTLSKESIENMVYNNRDGAGFMWRDSVEGTVEGRKGFMDFKATMEGLDSNKLLDPNGDVIHDISLVFHSRIATLGGVVPELTHPFPLSKHDARLKALKWSAAFGLAHNGSIRGMNTGVHPNTVSDTYAFCRDYLHHISIKRMLGDKGFMDIFQMALGSNKVAIMSGGGAIYLIGDFFQGSDGNIYSNSTFLRKQYSYKAYTDNTRSTRGWSARSNKLYPQCTLSVLYCSSCQHHHRGTFANGKQVTNAHCSLYGTATTADGDMTGV